MECRSALVTIQFGWISRGVVKWCVNFFDISAIKPHIRAGPREEDLNVGADSPHDDLQSF